MISASLRDPENPHRSSKTDSGKLMSHDGVGIQAVIGRFRSAQLKNHRRTGGRIRIKLWKWRTAEPVEYLKHGAGRREHVDPEAAVALAREPGGW